MNDNELIRKDCWASRPALVLSSILVVFLIASCELFGDEKSPIDTNVLIPLDVGNYWEYEKISPSGTSVGTYRVEISRAVPVNFEGRRYSAYAQTVLFSGLPGPDYDHAWLYANGPGGIYSVGGVAETDTLVLRHLFRKYPGRVGDEWDAVRLIFRLSSSREFAVEDTVRVSLVATNEQFQTPAGRYRCHVYKWSFRPAEDVVAHWNVYEYYAPGVGLVAEVIRSFTPGEPEDPDWKEESVLLRARVK